MELARLPAPPAPAPSAASATVPGRRHLRAMRASIGAIPSPICLHLRAWCGRAGRVVGAVEKEKERRLGPWLMEEWSTMRWVRPAGKRAGVVLKNVGFGRNHFGRRCFFFPPGPVKQLSCYMWAIKICFVRGMGRLILVQNILERFILFIV